MKDWAKAAQSALIPTLSLCPANLFWSLFRAFPFLFLPLVCMHCNILKPANYHFGTDRLTILCLHTFLSIRGKHNNSGAFPIKNVPESVRAKRLDPCQPMRDKPVHHVTRDSSLTCSPTGCSSSRTQDAGIPVSARAGLPKPPASSHCVLSQLLRSCLRVDGRAAAWCQRACQTLTSCIS